MQTHMSRMEEWFKTWRISVNETKSVNITFTLKKDTCPPIKLNDKVIPQENQVKYLGMHLDRRLTWRPHIWNKRKHLNLKVKKMYWLLGKRSQLSLENKLRLYLSLLKPVWAYGIQMWGMASKTNIDIIERFQNKTLRSLVDAPWYMPNNLILKDLKISSVQEEIKASYRRYDKRLSEHPNNLARALPTINKKRTRLKRLRLIETNNV
ncbi:hypothetical protein TKK_0012811 [Trichogramma kaykai]